MDVQHQNKLVAQPWKILFARHKRDLLLSILVACLLYTSDAADERSSVDLGGRRIIKKKKRVSIMLISSIE